MFLREFILYVSFCLEVQLNKRNQEVRVSACVVNIKKEKCFVKISPVR